MSGVRILGIDPGLNKTGWGIVESDGSSLRFVGCGTLGANARLPMAERLRTLHEGLSAVIAAHRPDEAAIEETFVSVNAMSTLKLGNARGALMLSLAIAGLEVGEYAATLIKKTVVGGGRAEKGQVGHMVQVLLPGCGIHGADAMDALAIAITHAQHRAYRRLASA